MQDLRVSTEIMSEPSVQSYSVTYNLILSPLNDFYFFNTNDDVKTIKLVWAALSSSLQMYLKS